MASPLVPVPADRMACTQLAWHPDCEVLQASPPHVRVKGGPQPVFDLHFSVSPEQLAARQPVVISFKFLLSGGALTAQLLGEDQALWRIDRKGEHEGELVIIPTAPQILLRVTLQAGECALTFLQISYSPREQALTLPLHDPPIFPNWERVYQHALLTASERLRRQAHQHLSHPTPMAWHRGLEIMLYPRDGLTGVVAISGCYEPHDMLALKTYLREGDSFIDCGANIGLYSLYAARLVGQSGKVFSFEPSPREMQRLQEHILHNHLGQVQAFDVALSDHDGEAVFHIAQGGGENTLADSFGYKDTQHDDAVTVRLTTLDQWAAQHAPPCIRMIKIDVEGAEAHVLRGAPHLLAAHRPVVLLEYFPSALHRMGTAPQTIFELLEQSRYRCLTVDSLTAQPTPLQQSDAITHSVNILAVPEELI